MDKEKSLKKHISRYKAAKASLKKKSANFKILNSLMKMEKFGMHINGK